MNAATRETNTSEKQKTNASAWRITRRRASAVRSACRSATDMPVTNERYEGKSGRTHGERNEKSPAVNATTIPSGSLMSAREPADERMRGRVVPVARPECQRLHRPVAIDD